MVHQYLNGYAGFNARAGINMEVNETGWKGVDNGQYNGTKEE